jgi:hypothetical protein
MRLRTCDGDGVAALIPILPLAVLALLVSIDASVSVMFVGLQVAVLVSYALAASIAARTGATAPIERLVVAVSSATWRWGDLRVIDGAVNSIAVVVRAWSAMLRRAQTGSVRTYAASVMAGVVVILGYYLWR